MGYTLGTATDNAGKQYQVITDIRVYKGDYYGAVSTFPAGGTTTSQKKAHGTQSLQLDGRNVGCDELRNFLAGLQGRQFLGAGKLQLPAGLLWRDRHGKERILCPA